MSRPIDAETRLEVGSEDAGENPESHPSLAMGSMDSRFLALNTHFEENNCHPRWPDLDPLPFFLGRSGVLFREQLL